MKEYILAQNWQLIKIFIHFATNIRAEIKNSFESKVRVITRDSAECLGVITTCDVMLTLDTEDKVKFERGMEFGKTNTTIPARGMQYLVIL